MASDKIRIRRAQAQDCRALLALIRDHAEFEQSTASIKAIELTQIIANSQPPVQIFVAIHDGRPLAFAALTIDYSLWRARYWGHLDCLYVAAKARGQGIGAQLFRHMVSVAHASGADRLEWQTPDWNKRAGRFYETQGATAAKKLRFGIALDGFGHDC